MDPSAALLMTTVSSGKDADALASALVEARLAACVQQVPIRSTYRWEGELAVEPEVLLLVKTTDERADAAAAFLEEHHPYEVPEILVVPGVRASAPYLAWMVGETRPG
jgi:periplasmic divalent cation tolerance protein